MTLSERRKRILVVAEAANPEWASVPLVGWSLCQALREVVDAHVVTQARNRDAILRAGWREGIDFTTIDSETVAKPMWRFDSWLRKLTGLGWTTTSALAALPYYYFEHLLWKKFGPRVRAGDFDIVHRVTPLSPTTPSLLANRCKKAKVPFVLGPLNGGVPWPPGYDNVRRREGEWLSYVRDAYKLLPGYKSTRSAASAIIVGSRATREQLSATVHDRAIYVPENAIDPERFKSSVQGPVGAPLRVAFVGRLVPYKGADILIDASRDLLQNGRLILDIIGDGPEMPLLRRKVEEFGLGEQVRLDGWVDHTQLERRLVDSDVLAFPSIREFGGGVVLEAMALGLVPIVVDYAGPAELVTESTGHRIPIGNRVELVERFRQTLTQLVDNPHTIRPLGERARRRVFDKFTWQAKASQMNEVYSWVLGQAPMPDFGMPFPDESED